ncbi:MAG: DUF4292 domain-containing protein [Bacteroidales bacterium]|nr:DUF4292 domain-containing protein [Bacteroidales bacterium]MDE6630635.1 DUF4292 domain-containing protein [Bacteroidales bacterium]
MDARRIIRGFVAVFLLWGAVACQDERKDTAWQNQSFVMDEEIGLQAKDSVDFILRNAMQHNTRFETFSTPLDLKLRFGKTEVSLGGQLRIADGEVIWGNFTKFFIEPIRYRITPDTLIIWNKFDNSAVVYSDTGAADGHSLPQVFRFVQCLFLRQIDTGMMTGERTLAASTAEDWTIRGIVADSIAWRAVVGKDDFRLRGMTVAYKEKGSEIQAEMRYLEDNGFECRLSLNEQEMIKARIRYTKVKWNAPLTYPMNFDASTKVDFNHGLLRESRQMMADSIALYME